MSTGENEVRKMVRFEISALMAVETAEELQRGEVSESKAGFVANSAITCFNRGRISFMFSAIEKFTVAQGQLQEEEDLLAQEETKLSALKLLQQRAGEWEKSRKSYCYNCPYCQGRTISAGYAGGC